MSVVVVQKRILEPINTARYRRILAMVSRHDAERYLVHLCEMCFFGTLATVREMHRGNHMFDDDYEAANPDTFGRDYSNREII